MRFFGRTPKGKDQNKGEQIPEDPYELARETIEAFSDCIIDKSLFANNADKEAFGETIVKLRELANKKKKIQAYNIDIMLLQFLWMVAKNTHDATHSRAVRFRIQHNGTEYTPLYTIKNKDASDKNKDALDKNKDASETSQYCLVDIRSDRVNQHIAPVWSDVVEKLKKLDPPIEKNPDDDQHTTDIDGRAQHAGLDQMVREVLGRIGLNLDDVKAHIDRSTELFLESQKHGIEIDNEAYKIEYDEAILINVKRDTANVDIPRKIRVYNRRYEVKRISFGAFIDCERTLVSVTIPESVEDIASGTFDNCAKLREINVAEGNSRYSSKNGILYDKSGTELIKYPAGNGATEFTIPDRVTAIGQGAFKHCTSLESIFIPTGVVAIGKRAFKYCTNLRSILIPDSVESIGDSAFDNCKFVEVTMPANAIESMTRGDLQIVTIIGEHDIPENAFSSARNLEKVTINDSVGNIGDRAFDRCSSLVEVTIGAGVKKIGNNAFSNCTSLQSVQLGEGLEKIGTSAFSNCEKLEQISIPESVTSIEKQAFYHCESLQIVTLGSNLEKIGGMAFNECRNLKETIFGDPNGWKRDDPHGLDAHLGNCCDKFVDRNKAAECLRESISSYKKTT